MKKRVLAIFMTLVIILSLCGCGSFSSLFSSSDSYESGGTENSAAYYGAYDTAAVADGEYGGFSSNAVRAMSASSDAEAAVNSESASENPDKIIYSSDVTLETLEFDNTIAGLEALIEQQEAWIESSSLNSSNYKSIQKGIASNRSASYTIRVPGENFTSLMSSLSSLGNIPYSSTYTENVTTQYYDTEARMKAYQAQEDRLLELLDEAESVSDVIEIENELTDVRYKIESLQTQLNSWDREVSYSTIYLTVNEVSVYTPEVQKSYGERLQEALNNGIAALKEFLIDLTEALPILLVLILIVVIVVLLIKLCVRAGKAGREKRKSRVKVFLPENESQPETKQKPENSTKNK